MWVWQSPSIATLKIVRVLYEIRNARRGVVLHHISVAEIPNYGVL